MRKEIHSDDESSSESRELKLINASSGNEPTINFDIDAALINIKKNPYHDTLAQFFLSRHEKNSVTTWPEILLISTEIAAGAFSALIYVGPSRVLAKTVYKNNYFLRPIIMFSSPITNFILNTYFIMKFRASMRLLFDNEIFNNLKIDQQIPLKIAPIQWSTGRVATLISASALSAVGSAALSMKSFLPKFFEPFMFVAQLLVYLCMSFFGADSLRKKLEPTPKECLKNTTGENFKDNIAGRRDKLELIAKNNPASLNELVDLYKRMQSTRDKVEKCKYAENFLREFLTSELLKPDDKYEPGKWKHGLNAIVVLAATYANLNLIPSTYLGLMALLSMFGVVPATITDILITSTSLFLFNWLVCDSNLNTTYDILNIPRVIFSRGFSWAAIKQGIKDVLPYAMYCRPILSLLLMAPLTFLCFYSYGTSNQLQIELANILRNIWELAGDIVGSWPSIWLSRSQTMVFNFVCTPPAVASIVGILAKKMNPNDAIFIQMLQDLNSLFELIERMDSPTIRSLGWGAMGCEHIQFNNELGVVVYDAEKAADLEEKLISKETCIKTHGTPLSLFQPRKSTATKLTPLSIPAGYCVLDEENPTTSTSLTEEEFKNFKLVAGLCFRAAPTRPSLVGGHPLQPQTTPSNYKYSKHA